MASVGAYVVLRSNATVQAVRMAVFALAVVVVLGGYALGHAERPVLHVFALGALVGIGTGAGAVAFFVTGLAGFVVRLINSDNTIINNVAKLGGISWKIKYTNNFQRRQSKA